MARAVSKKAAEPIQHTPVPQLLDTKSDYNNYSNLSYFISQYKRAVEIINECNTFYRNFLRNKLLSKSDIEHTPGINLLDMRFKLSEFEENVKRLYRFFIYKTLSKEFAEKLTKYQYVACYEDVLGHCGESIGKTLSGYRIEAINGGIPMGKEYFSYLIDAFCENRWNVDDKEEKEHYQWRDVYFDKILARSGRKKGGYDDEIEGFSKTGDNTGKIYIGNGKYTKVKTVDLERFTNEWKSDKKDWSKGNRIWKSTGEFDTFIVFGKEELKMIEILREFHKKYDKVKHDMLINPTNYVDLWMEYVNTILSRQDYEVDEEEINVVKIGNRQITKTLKTNKKVNKNFGLQEPGDYVVHHKGVDTKTAHRFMFAPVNYTVGMTGYVTKEGKKRENTHDKLSGMTYFQAYDGDEYVVGEYSIDAVKFLNTDWLQAKFDKKEVKGFSDGYYSKRPDDFYVNKRKLQLQIENVHPDALKAAKLNLDLILRDEWYYVLIDNTPYLFTNDLSRVKINYDEEKNILECSFKTQDRRKKAPWPGWMPWIVTTNYYELEFDCRTNEPISYDYSYDQVEEKCN